jgi:hypothetical protein
LHSEVKTYFHQQIGLNVLEGTSKLLHLRQAICVVLNIARFIKQIKNNGRVLNCRAGSGEKSPVFSIMWEVKKYCIWSRRIVIA